MAATASLAPRSLAGTNTVGVTATDASGNTTTANYEVDVAAASDTFTYDANGNLTADGSRGYEWDAKNRLVAVTSGANRSECAYDGYGRQVRIVERVNGSTTSDERSLWCGSRLCEGRDSGGGTITRRLVSHGVRDGTTDYFYTRDHLGSVMETTDASGIVQARYEYDPWGRRTKLSGTAESVLGFTGQYFHSTTGLHLAPYRAYEANLGRWVSSDPIVDALFLAEGPNLYAYVGNRPGVLVDPTGGKGRPAGVGIGGIAGAGAAAIFTIWCVKTVESVWTEWQNPYESIDPSQRIKHCIAECEITKNCLGGSTTAAIAGWAREAFGDGDQGDRDAGKKGREAAQKCPARTCFLQCEDLLKKGVL